MRGALMVVLMTAAMAVVADETDYPMRGMRSVLEHYEDGSVKMQFAAARMRRLSNGEVEASEATLESFAPDGEMKMRIKAGRCWYNPATGRIDTDTAVRMDRGDMVVTGTGMEWKSSEQTLRLYSKVWVVLKDSAGLGKVLPQRPVAPNAVETPGQESEHGEGGE